MLSPRSENTRTSSRLCLLPDDGQDGYRKIHILCAPALSSVLVILGLTATFRCDVNYNRHEVNYNRHEVKGVHPNRVRRVRVSSGYSASAFAETVGISRQALHLIETGATSPSTAVALRMAQMLSTTVEHLFGSDPVQMTVEVAGDVGHSRVYIAAIGQRQVARQATAWDGPPAHGLVAPRGDPSKATLLVDDPAWLQDTLFLSGCEPALKLVASHVLSSRGGQAGVWWNVSNEVSLDELARGITHVAAVHVPTGSARPNVSQRIAGPLQWSKLVTTRFGWMVHPVRGDGFEEAKDLVSGRFRLANRPPGAGARELLDLQLAGAGISRPEDLRGYAREWPGHRAVAEAIEWGVADVGIGPQSMAEYHGLRFIPLQEESTWLLMPKAGFTPVPVLRLYDALCSDRLAAELRAMGAYDTAHMGDEEEVT